MNKVRETEKQTEKEGKTFFSLDFCGEQLCNNNIHKSKNFLSDKIISLFLFFHNENLIIL